MYLYSAYHSRPYLFSGCELGTMCLTAHLPALPVPGGAIPPPIIKYISLYATYLHPIYPGKHLPLGPSPWSPQCWPSLPPTPGGLPQQEVGASVRALGSSRGCWLRVRAQLSSDQVLEKKYTPLQSYTRGERRPGPPSSPDTHDSEEGKQKRRGTRPEGWPRGTPLAAQLSLHPVAHLARGVGSQGTRATANLEAPCSPHLGLKPQRRGLGFCFLKEKSEKQT